MGSLFIYTLEQVNAAVSAGTVETAKTSKRHHCFTYWTVKAIYRYSSRCFCFNLYLSRNFYSKGIISPIAKLMKSAEKVASGEEIEIKQLPAGKRNEVDELVNTFV
ncbi:MAG: hypothetical protein ACLUD1_08425 [Clostridia bacterium]